MLRLAWKTVRHNPKRLILTSVAVMLGVTLVSATYVLTASMQLGIGDLNEAYYGSGRVVVEPDPGFTGDAAYPLLTDATLDAIRALPGVSQVEGRIDATGDAPLLGPDGKPFTGAPTLVFSWSDNPEISRSTVVEGAAPERSGEIVLDVGSFQRGGWAIGDTLRLATFDGIRDYRLVGVVRFGDQNILQGATLVYLTLDDARAVRVGDGGYDSIDVVPANGVDDTSLVGPVSEALPPGARALTSEALLAEESQTVADVMGYIDAFALVFAFVSVFVGAYIIANTFRIVVTQRTREIGLLRAIAASGAQIRRMILLEATVIAAAASAAGIGLGWLLAFGLLKMLESTFGNTYNSIPLPLDAVVWGLIVGFGVTLLSALLPAIHASRIHPMEALREAGAAPRKSLRVRNIVGGALAGAGIVVIAVGLWVPVPAPIAWIAPGALALVLGATLLAAGLLVPLAYGLRSMLGRAFGVPGTLAANNIHREPRRSANTAAALMIGVMLLSLTATVASSARDLAERRVAGNIAADLYVSSSQMNLASGPVVGEAAYEIVKDVDGVADTMRWGFAQARVDDREYRVSVLDTAVADEMYTFDTTPSIERTGDGVFIGPSLVEQGYGVGDVLTLDGTRGSLNLTITGEYNGTTDGDLFVDWEAGARLAGNVKIVSLCVTVDPGRDVAEVRASLEAALADFPLITVYEPSDLVHMANLLVTMLLAFISALLSGALVIAVLGIANTLMLSVTERTREIGLLRAVGVGRRAIRRMIRLESVVMAMFGTALGMILGVGLGLAIIVALKDIGFTSLAIPWLPLLVYGLLAVLAALVAAALPARRAARLNILDAIEAE